MTVEFGDHLTLVCEGGNLAVGVDLLECRRMLLELVQIDVVAGEGNLLLLEGDQDLQAVGARFGMIKVEHFIPS